MRSVDNRRFFLRTAALLAVILFLSWFAPLASACPTCREALVDGHGGDLMSGYFWSIVFMMSMPFLLLGSFALYCYWQIRKARLAHEGGEA